MTIADVRLQIEQSTVRAVVEAAIERARAEQSHSLLEVIETRALERADAIDVRLQKGDKVGPLAGIPFIAKDNMLTFASKTTAAATILENFEAPFQAEVIERLEAAGAICIAKANLDAFAHGGSTENSAFGPTTNPHDVSRVAGGSSGGSAAAVALNIVPFALGTDTGGSIREPASFCGVIGFKPTYGAVSRYGVVAMASSTDVVGTLSHTVADAEEVMAVIAGKDSKDSTTINNPFDTGTSSLPIKLGVVKEWLAEGVSSDVRRAVEAAIEKLRSDGHEIVEVSLPSLSYALAVYYIVVPAEVASNLARYDGIRYGNRPAGTTDLSSIYEQTRTKGFMLENKRRIMIGNYVLSSGYYDAYFQKAARVRTLIMQEMDDALQSVDLLIGPTAPMVAFELGKNTHDPLQMYLADQMTVAASLGGHPAISIPISSEGLPVGLQAVGRRARDRQVLSFAAHAQEIGL